jgi:hypothetical protein
MLTSWGYWLMLHPESTAYNLFGGDKYQPVPLPTEISAQVQGDVAAADPRLSGTAPVLGVSIDGQAKAYPLDSGVERAVYRDTLGGRPLAVFWYQPTRTAVAFSTVVDGRPLTFDADEISPESAPVKDRETGSRWTLAGRAVDGPLRGTELGWVDSLQCRWYAWSAEYPETEVFASGQ